jgi:hypothetical protein
MKKNKAWLVTGKNGFWLILPEDISKLTEQVYVDFHGKVCRREELKIVPCEISIPVAPKTKKRT